MKYRTYRARMVALRALRVFLDQDMPVFAGCATLFLITASFPLLIWIMVLVNHMPDYSIADLTDLLCRFLPQVPEIQQTVLDLLNNLSAQSTTFVASFAAVTTLFSASGGMAAIQKGLQRLTPGARCRFYDRLLAIVYTVAFEVVLLVIVLLQGLRSVFPPLSRFVTQYIGTGALLETLRRILSYSQPVIVPVILLIVLLIYTFVPGGRRTLRSQLAGAIFATVGWLVFSRIFSFYILHFWKLSYIYGSLTAVILIILWLYVIINLLFLGAAINAALQHYPQL
ncbi:MAG: YihY/virulence factor BrkB family protein [Gemmiger sp.]|uniref:YihY/virulence factor BrkB family protein n=1 Tax=Gemmiger sp. TaxID=2049027 RepID=UPI002E770DE0|nr:YihY/virulence factor BrkB family protein [Gemmiger sp.]MEE0800348.1 YihY/virulence factor BrkB family protein [Gemmiger sp.]